MKTEWINELIIKEVNSIKVIEGGFSQSMGGFRVTIEGEGNDRKNTIELYGNQYEDITFVIYGEWEIRKVAELMQVIANE